MSDNMNQLPAPEIKRLCDVCDGVYSWYMSDEPDKDITLRSVADARNQPECPLCALAINFVFHRNQVFRHHRELDDVPQDLLYFHIIQDYRSVSPELVIRSKAEPSHSRLDGFPQCLYFDLLYESFVREQGPYPLRHRLESIVNIDKVNRWIERCRSEHQHRRDPKFERALVGLFEAGGLNLIDTVTLEVYTVCSSPVPAYVALSYVWGKREENNDFERTTSPSNQNDRKVRLEALPRTLRDAILFSRDLGTQYIWIDELCIDQSHEPTKLTAIEYMGAIYAAADLVVVAGAGGNATSGLPGTKDHPRQKTAPLMEALTSRGDCIQFVDCKRSRMKTKVSSSTWDTRGWTFQEYAFAQRSLFVFSDEMFFDCPHTSYIEREAYTYAMSTDRLGLHERKITEMEAIPKALSTSSSFGWSEYSTSIIKYTKRHLTREEDRIAALRGILSEIFGHHDDVALQTGLPMCYFGLALTWQLPPPPNIIRDRIVRRDPAQDIPSWSWGSAGWPVIYDKLYPPHPSQRDAFTYQKTGVNAVLGRPLDTFPWHEFGLPIDPKTMDSFLQSPILEPGHPFPIIHLMTVSAHAYLEPARQQLPIMYYGTIGFPSPPGNPTGFSRSTVTFRVDQARFGQLDVTRPWRLAVVWTDWQEEPNWREMARARGRADWEDAPIPRPPPLHWVLLLRKVGDYHERVSIGTVSSAELVERDATWDYIKLI